MWSYYILLLLVTMATSQQVNGQEVSTPSSLLSPRNFNHHPFDAVQFLKSLKEAEPTKQGPVLFPNDAPPPPRPPLIVTSRPLTESIARSELNNTLASQSQVHGFLARYKDYRPYIPTPSYDYNVLPTRVPYSDVLKKYSVQDNRYDDYEEHTVLPIYKVLADHAKQKVLKINQKNKFNYQPNQPELHNKYQNEINDDSSADYDHKKNYAFSYTVKDHKTGDDFSHSQQSSGAATNGEYRVRLPDGRMQIVSYTADENGYKAEVRYDGEEKSDNGIDNDYINNDNTHNRYTHNDKSHDYIHKGNTHNNYLHNGNTHNSYADNSNTHNDYLNNGNTHNDYLHNGNTHNDYLHTGNTHNDYLHNANTHNDYTDNSNTHNDYTNSQNTQNVDYVDRSNKYLEKLKPVNEKDDYYYPDVSKEYYNDYSNEYNNNYQPHKSKYSVFAENKHVTSSVSPNYDQLKDLLVTKDAYKTEQNYDQIDLKYNVPSTTPIPSYEGTTEHVVLITTKPTNLYTNIKHSIPTYNSLISTPRIIEATTPRGYLVSTIASLRNKISLATKPILSENYVNKINKYLSFN